MGGLICSTGVKAMVKCARHTEIPLLMLNVIRPEINISAIFRTGTSLKYIYKNYIEMREWME
jgi:hypothetical protein